MKKWIAFCSGVILMLVMMTDCPVMAATKAKREQPSSSWTESFTNFFSFGKSKKGENEKKEEEVVLPGFGKGVAGSIQDFLPNDLPGIIEYRRAMTYKRWENQPSHKAQEVYDLFAESANKGNVLGLVRQYEMYLENPDFSTGGNEFFNDRLAETCQLLYPAAVRGNADTQYLYAHYCVDMKSAQAQSWFTRALKQYKHFADRDVPYAQYMMAEIYHDFGEEKKSQDWFVKAAKNGSSEAVCRIKLNVFQEEELWKDLPPEAKRERSCAVYQSLKVMSQIEKDKVLMHVAMRLLQQMPVGYSLKGFKDGGYYFNPVQEEDNFWLKVNLHERKMKDSEKKESDELFKKYKNKKVAFIDEYMNRSGWNIFGR